MGTRFLDDVLVVELGERTGVGACGSLLAELGAEVVAVEPRDGAAGEGTKWRRRALAMAGKHSVAAPVSAEDAWLSALIARADVILLSSDCQPAWAADAAARADRAVVCDITAMGRPAAGSGFVPDALVQALCGIVDTTGERDGAPTLCEAPVVEDMAALYALTAVLAGLRARRGHGRRGRADIALYDCAVSALASFLPQYFAGRQPQRIGNRHPAMSPWNGYQASDGWVLLSTGSDEQWLRVCELIGRPELGRDPRYASPEGRVRNNDEVDRIVEAWTREHTVDACVAAFNAAKLPCGPVYQLADLFDDAALRHRDMVHRLDAAGASLRLPGSVFRGSAARGAANAAIPERDGSRRWLDEWMARRPADRAAAAAVDDDGGGGAKPLAGLKVLELGSYTTAPICGRQLGALGADVVKIEPPQGDLSRPLTPTREGQGYFFTISNSDKRSLRIDLRTDDGKALFRALLARADVLVENLRPGSLAKMGFDPGTLLEINPRLVSCAITGFGGDSPYAGLAAMDTTVQGISGIMDLARSEGRPYKIGISIADIVGGLFGLAAVMAALAYRDVHGCGQHVDISMQDATAWLTRASWNDAGEPDPAHAVVGCEDGYLLAESGARLMAEALQACGCARQCGQWRSALPRALLAAFLVNRGIAAAPVLSVAEVVADPRCTARGLLVEGRTGSGETWPLLASPIRFDTMLVQVARALGAIGSDGPQVLADWIGAVPGRHGPEGLVAAGDSLGERT
ncbi:Formyl-coenzyme A transferase [Pigmentiphaga humi]|uniref:Formyl-coenzyme A transferase n=1 Tax=Pigmentiphaga humi TaxID=2478468 RepID=A0A3P4B6S5_9BURK|nr:CoA transferase [Pigmentiphaga humi]VCU71621.1 Formyl-coenzyme A transferase [Pigmentiphaga humi]